MSVQIRCQFCQRVHGNYKRLEDAPKKFTCPDCGTVQRSQIEPFVRGEPRRNYPEGYFD